MVYEVKILTAKCTLKDASGKPCGGEGVYQKGWDMKQKRQKVGGTHGETEETGKVIKMRLYRCKKCKRLFRKGEAVGDNSNRAGG